MFHRKRRLPVRSGCGVIVAAITFIAVAVLAGPQAEAQQESVGSVVAQLSEKEYRERRSTFNEEWLATMPDYEWRLYNRVRKINKRVLRNMRGPEPLR